MENKNTLLYTVEINNETNNIDIVFPAKVADIHIDLSEEKEILVSTTLQILAKLIGLGNGVIQ